LWFCGLLSPIAIVTFTPVVAMGLPPQDVCVLCIIINVCISQKEWLYRAWNMLRIATIFPFAHLDQPDDVTAQGNGISAPYTDVPTICFLKKDIFPHNVHQYAAQEFLIGLIVLKCSSCNI
jgi:hypothetical protein